MKNKETREEAGTQKTAEQTAPTPDIQDSAKEEPVSEESAAGTKLQAELEGLKADRDALQKKYDDLNDRYLRTLAEYDNFRKRTQREKDAIYSDAIVDAVTKLLPILDSFERAKEYPCTDENFKKGIDMICNSVEESFASLGITEIPAKDQPFDPNLHNAVLHVEDPTVGENTIVEILRKGYRLGDRVIRFTMVKVAN